MGGGLSKIFKRLVGGRVKMNAIRIHPGLFTSRASLAKLLEVCWLDLNEGSTESRNSSCNSTQLIGYQDYERPQTLNVRGKRFQLMTSFLVNYQIYVEENPSSDSRRNDIVEMATTGPHCVFGEAIAVRPNRAAEIRVDSKEFATELIEVMVHLFLLRLPTRHSRVSAESASSSRNINVLQRLAIL